MAAKKIRLFKLASEINIGREEIVKFLQAKGFDIQNKPTTTLDDKMVEAVHEKFKREIRAVEVQREKIQKHKTTKKQTTEKKEEVIKKEEEVLDVPVFVLSEVEKQKQEKSSKSEVDKIQIPDSKKSDEKIESDLISKSEDSAEKPVKETTDSKIISEEKRTTPDTKSEKIEPAQHIQSEKEVKEIKTEKKPVSDKNKVLDEKEITAEQPKPKEDEEELGVAPQLRGLTVLGKIDMKKKKKPILKKKPPKPEVENDIEDPAIEVASKKKKFRHRTKKSDIAKPEIASKPPLEEVDDSGPKSKRKSKKEEKKRKKRKSIRDQISEKDVDRAIKETMAQTTDSSMSDRAKARMKRKQEREEKEQKKQEQQEIESKTLQLTEFVTTSDLANLMGKDTNEIIIKCMELGLMVTINQRLDKDTIALIANDYDFDVEFVNEEEVLFIEDEEDSEESLKPRSPIVTIMGHVDHGKTSLLDYIRQTNVVSGEAGGITQHIGAYKVELDEKSITFLDTPGHEAFTAMRARGAQVTDIVVLIVAADDSVMPQTIEAISHANAARVPIVVAINKIDKPDANPDRIKQQLADHGVLVEDWGGKYQSVEISAKKGENVDLLLEKILLESEFLELKANPDRNARGTVIESNMRKGLGSVATIIIQKGTLKVGDAFVSGVYHGRVRAMLDDKGEKVEFAKPSDPVLVMGYSGLPEAGDTFVTTTSEQDARKIAIERQQLKREQELRQVRHITLDEISAQIQIGGVKDLNLVIKGDVAGSVEALSDSLLKLSRDEVRVNILHKGVGSITESDVMLAAASGAVVIGFNVTPTGTARKVSQDEKVDIRIYNIIYDCINEIQLALEGLLTPEYKEEVIATVEVRKTFKISKVGVIAGCYVLSGKIKRNDKVRVLQDGFKVFDGKISSLKRNKDDVKEVDQQFECGIQLDGFNDFNEGDIIEAYQVKEIKRTFK
jgi:translation initiation factor IF-2